MHAYDLDMLAVPAELMSMDIAEYHTCWLAGFVSYQRGNGLMGSWLTREENFTLLILYNAYRRDINAIPLAVLQGHFVHRDPVRLIKHFRRKLEGRLALGLIKLPDYYVPRVFTLELEPAGRPPVSMSAAAEGGGQEDYASDWQLVAL